MPPTMIPPCMTQGQGNVLIKGKGVKIMGMGKETTWVEHEVTIEMSLSVQMVKIPPEESESQDVWRLNDKYSPPTHSVYPGPPEAADMSLYMQKRSIRSGR